MGFERADMLRRSFTHFIFISKCVTLDKGVFSHIYFGTYPDTQGGHCFHETRTFSLSVGNPQVPLHLSRFP